MLDIFLLHVLLLLLIASLAVYLAAKLSEDE